jgi:hypothetical protein
MRLRSAHFDQFKGGPTLLIWGDAAGIDALSRLLRETADRSDDGSVELTTIAEPVDGNVISIRKSAQPLSLTRDSASSGFWMRIRSADLPISSMY